MAMELQRVLKRHEEIMNAVNEKYSYRSMDVLTVLQGYGSGRNLYANTCIGVNTF
jgi:hypothetical protein